MKKKGSAGMAASLVGLLALLMLMYIFVIPPDYREALLENNAPLVDTPGGPSVQQPDFNGGIIISKFIGKLDFTEDEYVGHFFPSVNLVDKSQVEVLTQASSALIRRSVFTNEPKYYTFDLEDPELVDNAKLGFSIAVKKGVLEVFVNDQPLATINDVQSKLLDIPSSMLKEKNVIEFRVSSPGIKFWATNEYLIDNFKVLATVKNTEGLEAESGFILRDSEFNKLEESSLTFYVDCAQVGSPLQIEVNGNNIYRSIPNCGGSLGLIDFNPEFLKSGPNDLTFKTESGNYFIDRVQIRNKLEESDRVIFYFDLSREELEFILDNAVAVARAEYTDDVTDKDVSVYLNGRLFDLNTRNDVAEYDVTPLLAVGINSVEIVPQKEDINMKKFEIYLADE